MSDKRNRVLLTIWRVLLLLALLFFAIGVLTENIVVCYIDSALFILTFSYLVIIGIYTFIKNIMK